MIKKKKDESICGPENENELDYLFLQNFLAFGSFA